MKAFLQQLLRADIYKRSQGRITRQITWAAMAITIALGLWRLSIELHVADWTKNWNEAHGFYLWFPGALLALGLWVVYRIVNMPAFADFLIAVEAEMNKVSWPTRKELIRASIVVLLTIFVMAAILAVFDVFWGWFFRALGVLPKREAVAAVFDACGRDWCAVLWEVWRIF